MPKVFPTQHIMTTLLLTTIAWLLVFVFYSSFKKENAYKLEGKPERKSSFLLVWLLFTAFAVRIAISCQVVGHKTDINCFSAWGVNIVNKGFASFYNPNSGMPDYPPGYMYVLGLMSRISMALGHNIHAADGSYDLVFVTLIKLPAIIADLASAYLVYRLASRKLSFAASFTLTAIVAFCPVIVYISSGWGQIDQILSLLIVLAVLALISNKPILGGIIYGFAILVKPQALMAGPLMALAYIFYVFDPSFFKTSGIESADTLGKRLIKTAIAVVCAFAIIIAAAIPFASEQFPLGKLLIQKYLGTATSYKFASVNAYNIFSLFGHNWASVDKASKLGLTFGQLGLIGMIFSVVFGGVLYFLGRKKNSGALFLALAFTFISLFTLGHYMHERYLFPALLLLVAAYLYYGDRNLLYLFFGYAVTAMLNCHAAFYYSQYHEYQLYWDTRIVFWCSLANVILFALLTFVVIRIMILGKVSGDVFRGINEKKPSVSSAE